MQKYNKEIQVRNSKAQQRKKINIPKKLSQIIDELQSQIYLYFNDDELKILQKVNRQFYYTVQANSMWKTLVFEIQQAEDKKLGSIQQYQNQNDDLESDSSDENEAENINQNSFLNQSEASTDIASQRKSRVQFNIPVNQNLQNKKQNGIISQNKGSQETQDNFMNNSLLSKQSSISNENIQKQGSNNFNFKKKSITLKKQNESQIGNNSFKETQNNISNNSLQQKLQQQNQVGVIKRPVGKNSKIMRPQSPRILQNNNKIDKSESIILKQKNSSESGNKIQENIQDQNQSQKMNQEQSKNIFGTSTKNVLKKSSDSVQKSFLYNRPGLNNLKKSLEQNDIVFAKKLKLQNQNQSKNQNSDDSNLIQNDPFNKTGFDFKKKTEINNNKIFQNQEDFYDEEGNKIQLRPQTNQVSQRRGAAKKQSEEENNNKSQKIFKIQLGLENLDMAFSSSQQFTQIQKNTQEFLRMIEFWILEMKKLDRILDIQAIQTDNLIEEAKVWGDNIKIYEKFEQELNDEYTKKAIKILGEKAQFDQDVKKKYYQFIKYKEKIGKNKKEIKEFAKEIEEDCLEDFQKLNSAYYTQYPNIYKATLDKILALYNDYPEIFNFRIYFVLEKIYQLLIKKMKQCHVKFQMCIDLENSEFVNNLLQGFESYISQLGDVWKEVVETKQNIDSTNKIHQTMFQKWISQLKYVIKDINKMRGVFEKLNKQEKFYQNELKKQNNPNSQKYQELEKVINLIQQMLEDYKIKKDVDFDIFDYNQKNNWEKIISQFKSQLKEVREQMQVVREENQKEITESQIMENPSQIEFQDQKQDDNEGEFNPFSTAVGWKIG